MSRYRQHDIDAAVLRQRMAKRLAWQQAAHDPRLDPRNRLEILSRLRSWQTRRLESSFRHYLADPRMRPAAVFFLTDLYGDKDFSGRDRDVARVMPLMSRLLPHSLLGAAVEAVELEVLSHAFDLRMARHLQDLLPPGGDIGIEAYAEAYRRTGGRRLRSHQVELVLQVGWTLDAAVKKHGVAKLLRASRTPARLLGLSELQGFLERGFTAFEALGGAKAFLEGIGRSEHAASRRLFAGEADPFRLGMP
jgi:hypothetical protein